MSELITLAQAAVFLGIAESRMYPLDRLLMPTYVPRGTKMRTRMYDTEHLAKVRNEIDTGTSRASPSGARARGPYAKTTGAYRPAPFNRPRARTAHIALPSVQSALAVMHADMAKTLPGARSYGLTARRAAEIFVDQGVRCGCCGGTDPQHTNWNIDHDHDTGQVRGILCSPCNRFIGQSRDPVTGATDCLVALEASYVMAKAYLTRKSPATSSPDELSAEIREIAVERSRARWEKREKRLCSCGCKEPTEGTRSYVPGHYRRPQRTERLFAARRAYGAVRAALGAVVLAVFDATPGPPRHENGILKKVRDTKTMADRISATRQGRGQRAIHQETIRRMLADGRTYREIFETTGVPSGTVRGWFGNKYKPKT